MYEKRIEELKKEAEDLFSHAKKTETDYDNIITKINNRISEIKGAIAELTALEKLTKEKKDAEKSPEQPEV